MSTNLLTSYFEISLKKELGFSIKSGLPQLPLLTQFIVLLVMSCSILAAIFMATCRKISLAASFILKPRLVVFTAASVVAAPAVVPMPISAGISKVAHWALDSFGLENKTAGPNIKMMRRAEMNFVLIFFADICVYCKVFF